MTIQSMGARSGQRKKTRSERNNKHKKVMDPVRFFKYPSCKPVAANSSAYNLKSWDPMSWANPSVSHGE